MVRDACQYARFCENKISRNNNSVLPIFLFFFLLHIDRRVRRDEKSRHCGRKLNANSTCRGVRFYFRVLSAIEFSDFAHRPSSSVRIKPPIRRASPRELVEYPRGILLMYWCYYCSPSLYLNSSLPDLGDPLPCRRNNVQHTREDKPPAASRNVWSRGERCRPKRIIRTMHRMSTYIPNELFKMQFYGLWRFCKRSKYK